MPPIVLMTIYPAELIEFTTTSNQHRFNLHDQTVFCILPLPHPITSMSGLQDRVLSLGNGSQIKAVLCPPAQHIVMQLYYVTLHNRVIAMAEPWPTRIT